MANRSRIHSLSFSRSLSRLFGIIIALFVLSGLGPLTIPRAIADPGGTMVRARVLCTATLLQDGRVLVAGGQIRIYGSDEFTKSAELYDPPTNTWTATGDMRAARVIDTAVLLPDGRVLVAGDHNASAKTNTAEIYNPATGRWDYTGSMSAPHAECQMVLLHNGLVLIPGGQYTDVAELYDPRAGTWSVTGRMKNGFTQESTTLLLDGRVLVTEGDTVELYDPTTGMWTYTGAMITSRVYYTQTLLSDGRVLVAGGRGGYVWLAGAELYDPATGMWSQTGSMGEPRERMTANVLADGKVVVIGGDDAGIFLSTSEEYDPATCTWQAGPVQLGGVRDEHTTTTLLDGSLLVATGHNPTRLIRVAERFTLSP
jgi:N-acetylneuraminic acid mutarotase